MHLSTKVGISYPSFGFLLLADVENEFAYLYASKYSAFDFRQDVCKGFQVLRVTRREEEEFFLLFFNGEGVSQQQQQTTHDILAAISICYYLFDVVWTHSLDIEPL